MAGTRGTSRDIPLSTPSPPAPSRLPAQAASQRQAADAAPRRARCTLLAACRQLSTRGEKHARLRVAKREVTVDLKRAHFSRVSPNIFCIARGGSRCPHQSGCPRCYWSSWTFNEHSTSATHVACPGTQRGDGHRRDGDDGLLPVHRILTGQQHASLHLTRKS